MTPTSATGRRDRRSRQGFTLVELMMTLLIIGLAAGAVVLTAPDARPSVTTEAETFAARLVRAREEAVLTNRPVAVSVDATGYGFSAFDVEAGWTPLVEGPFRRADWAEGVEATPVPANARFVFDPVGAAEVGRLVLSRDAVRRTVVVDAAGEVSLDD